MKNIKDILVKVLPTVGLVMTIDRWINYKFTEPKHIVEKAELENKFNVLEKANSKLNYQVTLNQDTQNLIRAKAISVNETTESYRTANQHVEDLLKLYKQSQENNALNQSEILRELNYKKAELAQIQTNFLSEHQDLTSMILRNCVKANSDGSLTSQSVQASSSEASSSQTTESVSNLIAKSNKGSDTSFNPTDADESSVLGPFYEFKDFFSKELSQLTAEELGLLSNALGFILLFSFFTTVVFIIIGESLIKYFKLDLRFPKLARIIKIRSTFNAYYLIFNIIIIYSIIIFFICINLYMFLTAP